METSKTSNDVKWNDIIGTGRITFLVILIVAWWMVYQSYMTVEASFLASIAKNQLEDGIVTYSVTKTLMKGGHGGTLINIVFLLATALTLRSPVAKLIKLNK